MGAEDAGGGDADAAEHRLGGELHGVELARGIAERGGVAGEVEVPAEEVLAVGQGGAAGAGVGVKTFDLLGVDGVQRRGGRRSSRSCG